MKISTLNRTVVALAVTLSMVLAGFGSAQVHAKSRLAAPPDPAKALAQFAQGKVYSNGPHGEKATSPSKVTITPAQLAQIKALHLTAAIALHYGGNDWSTAQVNGLKFEFAKLGIKVVGVTDANFKPDKQVSDIESLMAKSPKILVSIPTDPKATASAYQAAAKRGAHIVFMDNVPDGMTAGTNYKSGKNYVSVVSADNCGNGKASAYLMALKLHQTGKIALIYHAADFFVTKQRYTCFKQTIQQYPNIQIVEEQGIAGPDFAGDANKVAAAMVTKHPDLSAIWAVWDVPAEGVIAALRGAGNHNIMITTEDLGLNVAVAMAKNDFVVGLGAQRPFDQGVNEAELGALSWIGVKVPKYVALPALPVQKSNVLKAWKTVYHANPPTSLTAAISG